MPITVEQTTAEVQAFFQDLRTAAQNQIAQQNLPLIGAVPAIPTGALFQALELEVTGALAALDRGASAADIAVALRAIEIDGMHPISAHDSGDGIDITIAKEVGLHLTEKPFDLGGTVAGVGLELDGEFATKLTADLDVKLRLDSSGQLQVRDSTNPELAVGLDASLSLEGEGKLGFLTITAKDKDPNQPEVELDLGIDLASGDAGGLVATAAPPTVRAGLDLQIEAGVGVDTDEETGIPFSILPSISTELVIDYSAIDDTTPSIAFNDITVDVRSIYGILQQVLEPIAEILDTEPLGTVLDLATGPVPILDDLAPFLDTLPSLTNGDSVVSLADIAVWQSKLQGADPNVFLEIVSLLDLIRDLGLPSENQEMGAIVLGSIAFSAATNPTDLKSVFTSAVGDSGLDELDGFLNISGFLDDSLDDDVSEQFSAIPGLEIPLLKNPSEIVGLLFNEVYESVTLVTYDLPELKVEGGFSLSIPILPPIALKFTGNAGASIDLKIGYDTKAFEEAVAGAPFAFEDGFFFDATKPLASLTAELTAGAGFDALVLSAWATGGIHFAISASLDNKDGDNKVRLGELGGCFVDPITGKAWADVTVDVEIDFGLFSVSESIPIASVTLAEFDLFKCPPPRMPTSPPNQGLATVGAFGVPPELVLNVGDRASERVVTEDGESKQIPGENEFYFIGLAREPATNEGPFPSTQLPGAIIPDAIDVSAFGYTQRYGSAAAPVTSIRANFGSQNDSLVIAEEITHESHISGGEGNDFMSGGSGRDFFSGDNGEDYLVGKKGDDVLEGGARNDTLDGGQGADVLRGGTGRDKVTYANANKTTGDGVTIFWDESAGKLTAKGGEANGDTFDSIEYLVGTSFNDTLVGNPFLFLTELGLYNTLEGGDGSDLLIGAEVTGDFLIGGRGGDTIDGKSGIDGTTYVTSVGGVYIDLGARVFLLGDAEGDNLISIENVQGSSSNDTIYGDGANNEIDGFVGDDWLSGGGGTDKVSGHLGNDTIFGFGDGDTLDGGGSANAPGVDLLTYRVYTGGPVTVNLRTGQATRAGGSDTIAMAKWDVNPPVLANGTSTFENLEGTNLPGTGDSLTGDDSYNTVWGLAGNDTINGVSETRLLSAAPAPTP
jgi:Ca2+-binding RTX toxin-like protein